MSERAGDLTRGPILPRTLVFGAPLALAMAGHGLFNLVDMVIVARLGPGAVSAVTVGSMILPVAFVLFDGVINVAVALVSHFHGAGKTEDAREVAFESLVIAVAGGLGGGAVFFALSGPLVRFFDLEPEITRQGISYLRIMSGGMIGMFLILQTTGILRGLGNSIVPMVILIVSNVLNLGLAIVLVYGLFGFPKLGVAGSAWGTVIAQITGGLIGLAILWKGTHGISLRGPRRRGPLRFARMMLFLGLPTSLQLTTRVLAMFFLLRIAREAVPGIAGQALVDGVGVCIRLEMVAVFLGLGWAAAATPFVGQNVGAGEIRRAWTGTWTFVAWTAASMILVGALLWFLRRQTLLLIMPEMDEATLGFAVDYLRITVPCYALLSFALVISRALNGAGSTKTGMMVDMALYLLILQPLAWLLSRHWGGGQPDPRGAWWAVAAVHLLGAICYVVVFRRGRWMRKRFGRRAAQMRDRVAVT